MTWRLFYVRSGREYAVLAELVARGLDGYVPTETVWKGPARKRIAYKRPFMPSGYVFAELSDEDYATARGLPDVTGALRVICQTGEQTIAMDRHIGRLLAKWVEETRAEERAGKFDHTRRKGEGLTVGQKVKIVAGAFAGHLASITSLKGPHEVRVDVVKMGPMNIAAAKLEAVA